MMLWKKGIKGTEVRVVGGVAGGRGWANWTNVVQKKNENKLR